MPSPHEKFAVLAADIAVFTIQDGELCVLLIEILKKPHAGKWALPGGLVKPREEILHAAFRHLKEKTGVTNAYLEQLYTFGALGRDPLGRVVSVAYMALIPSEPVELETTEEYGGVGWFPVKKLPSLAYDHKEMVHYGVNRLRTKLEYTNIVYSLLPERFTLTELQKVYETILARVLDKRNFRKKFLSLGLIEATRQFRRGGRQRPAQLFKFKHRTFRELPKFFD
jgi:8-oxo-dGTP diphosphatase